MKYPVYYTFCCLAFLFQTACTPAKELQPNVLMIMVDDLNTDLGSYGHPVVRTPNIDQLASQGILFTRAYTQYPQCNQSRASLLTGLYPDQTKVLSLKEHFRDELPSVTTLPQHFRNNGYFTARVGKVFHQGVPNEIGVDGLDDPVSWDEVVNPRGIDVEVDEQIVSIVPPEKDKRSFGGTLSWLNLASEDQQHTDGKGADAAIRLMTENHPGKTGKPFFLALGFYRPHTPFIAPEAYFDLYPLEQIKPVEVLPGDRENKPVAALADRKYQADMSDLQKRQAIQAYYASISFIDAQLGRVTAALDKLGLADNTLLVFVSDHGYQLGLHGLWQKKDLFENTARVPLILVAPGQFKPGLKSATLTELIDIYPTLVALAGLDKPGSKLEGKNLQAILHGQQAPRKTALSQSWSAAHLTRPERRKMKIMGYSIRTDQYRYTEWAGGKEGVELYDYQSDPDEFQNQVMSEEYQHIARQMKSLLNDKLQQIQK